MDNRPEENLHRPFLYEAEGSRAAVLMVHGILGSPAQFEAAAKVLYGRGFTVMGVLLPGHGGSAKDFAAAKAEAWRQEVRGAVAFLKRRYERVLIVGHSMGGLLAVNEAVENGAAGVILMSTPMRVVLSPRAVYMSLRILFGDPAKDDEVHRSYRRANSVQKGPFWAYLSWLPRFWDLRSLIRIARRSLMRVRCPVLIIQSRCDETVSWKSQRILAKGLRSASVEVLLLKKSRHSHFHCDEAEPMYERICCFVEECSGRVD